MGVYGKKKYIYIIITFYSNTLFLFYILADKVAYCNLCENDFPFNGTTTTTLIQHLNKQHGKTNSISSRASAESIYDEDEDENDDETEDCCDENNNNGLTQSKKIKLDKKLIKFVVGTNQALCIVENPYFRDLVAELNKNYHVPGRKHLTKTMIPEEVSSCKNNYTKML